MDDNPAMVVGDYLGVAFPTTIGPLLDSGTAFLTEAFHAAGTLAKDNRVTAIATSKEFFGGGMGRKLWLSISYARPEPGLHTELFVKFPRDFGDPLRDLFGPLMEPEVRFALLSRGSGFPIAVPKCYFADYHAASKSGVLITERIAYGQGTIEVCPEKCAEYELDDPLGHYQAMTRTMAKLASHHKSGGFGAEIDRQFPFDPKKIDIGARIPYTPEELHGKLDTLRAFAKDAPQLFQDGLGDAGFLARFAEEAPLTLEHELAIRAYLNEQPDFIALCHWNMNLDNAWFWRDEAGQLQTGLLDWGSVAQMNVAGAFYGMLCAAETGFLNAHRGQLVELFVERYRAGGGPLITREAFTFMYSLALAVLGVAWILDAPSLVEREIPDYRSLADRYDPRIRNNFLGRAQLQLLMVLLNEWKALDIGRALRDFAARGEGSHHVVAPSVLMPS